MVPKHHGPRRRCSCSLTLLKDISLPALWRNLASWTHLLGSLHLCSHYNFLIAFLPIYAGGVDVSHQKFFQATPLWKIIKPSEILPMALSWSLTNDFVLKFKSLASLGMDDSTSSTSTAHYFISHSISNYFIKISYPLVQPFHSIQNKIMLISKPFYCSCQAHSWRLILHFNALSKPPCTIYPLYFLILISKTFYYFNHFRRLVQSIELSAGMRIASKK